MKIVTISREFGSGGRELGRYLADELGWTYYDKQIVSAIAQESELSEEYVARAAERGLRGEYPFTVRRTLSYSGAPQSNAVKVLVTQQKVVRDIGARGEDCVIVGRGADVLLREKEPLNLFVYADLKSRLRRCRERAPEGEELTDRELERAIRRVDAGRDRYHQLLTNSPWGRRESYHLCLNTTGLDLKALTPWVAEYVRDWFGGGLR